MISWDVSKGRHQQLMETLTALGTFTFIASITPGPNNLMLAASGIGFGFRRTLPHLLGVSAGFILLVLSCSLGVGVLVSRFSWVETALTCAGSAYLVVLSWRLRRLGITSVERRDAEPMSFAGAVLFQFANPKAWVMATTGSALFLPQLGGGYPGIALLCLVMAAVNLPCVSSWALLGASMTRALEDERRRRVAAVVLVILTLYAALALWF